MPMIDYEKTSKADEVSKLTTLAKEQYGIDTDKNFELFDRLLYVVYGRSPDGREWRDK